LQPEQTGSTGPPLFPIVPAPSPSTMSWTMASTARFPAYFRTVPDSDPKTPAAGRPQPVQELVAALTRGEPDFALPEDMHVLADGVVVSQMALSAPTLRGMLAAFRVGLVVALNPLPLYVPGHPESTKFVTTVHHGEPRPGDSWESHGRAPEFQRPELWKVREEDGRPFYDACEAAAGSGVHFLHLPTMDGDLPLQVHVARLVPAARAALQRGQGVWLQGRYCSTGSGCTTTWTAALLVLQRCGPGPTPPLCPEALVADMVAAGAAAGAAAARESELEPKSQPGGGAGSSSCAARRVSFSDLDEEYRHRIPTEEWDTYRRGRRESTWLLAIHPSTAASGLRGFHQQYQAVMERSLECLECLLHALALGVLRGRGGAQPEGPVASGGASGSAASESHSGSESSVRLAWLASSVSGSFNGCMHRACACQPTLGPPMAAWVPWPSGKDN
jgi:hypothetical protein